MANKIGPSADEAYLALVRALPPPSLGQILGFAHHVARAHSWYKHIPPLRGKKPFHFFLDPEASPNLGRELATRVQQGTLRQPTKETADHRLMFGFWNCDAKASDALSFPGGLRVRAAPGQWVPVPQSILQLGEADVDGFVHPLSSRYLRLFRVPPLGLDVLAEHLRRSAAVASDLGDRLPDDVVQSLWEHDMAKNLRLRLDDESQGYEPQCAPLIPFFIQEHIRQLRGLVGAMRRVAEFVYGP